VTAQSKWTEGVAVARAAHQIFDTPLVFSDPLATRVIRPATASRLRNDPTGDRIHRAFRAAIVARSRFAEDEIAVAEQRGVRQCIVVGAGLDTFAHRNPNHDLQVFEVDLPSTQAWKRRRFRDAGLSTPHNLTYVGLDLTSRAHVEALSAAGFNGALPCCVSMLGVALHVPRDVVFDLVRFVASCGPGSSIVFDYVVPGEHLRPELRALRALATARAASRGETTGTFLDPDWLATEARAVGFSGIEDLGESDVNERYFRARTDGLEMADSGVRMVRLLVE
jgi:methyltransferase (TIGR00027 family)